MYISGYKRIGLITDGPYSIVQHPLYVFSLIGTVGIGLASENLLVLALLIIFYALYYPIIIVSEESKLESKFGDEYVEYTKRTPKFLPKLSLYKEPDSFLVNTHAFVRNFGDGMWFIWIFILLQFVERLQDGGVLPVFLRIP